MFSKSGRDQELQTLFSNLVYWIALALPSWGGLALSIYGLAAYGAALVRLPRCARKWLNVDSGSKQ